MSPKWSLHQHVQDVLDNSDEVQPEKLARAAADSVPSNQLREALGQALENYVRIMISHNRTANPLVGYDAARVPRPSVRVAAVREAWLSDRVHVGEGTWKRLRDCTYGDLMYAAIERRRIARLTLAAAERYETLAKAVRSRGVSTVGELPPTDLLGFGTKAE